MRPWRAVDVPKSVKSGQRPPAEKELRIVVSALSSDAHTWNLVFIQLLLEELGHNVLNLGACVPDRVIADYCRAARSDLLVVASINGHGMPDGISLMNTLKEYPDLASMPVVIGGMLSTPGADNGHCLLAAGFDAVFDNSAGGARLRDYVDGLQSELECLPA